MIDIYTKWITFNTTFIIIRGIFRMIPRVIKFHFYIIIHNICTTSMRRWHSSLYFSGNTYYTILKLQRLWGEIFTKPSITEELYIEWKDHWKKLCPYIKSIHYHTALSSLCVTILPRNRKHIFSRPDGYSRPRNSTRPRVMTYHNGTSTNNRRLLFISRRRTLRTARLIGATAPRSFAAGKWRTLISVARTGKLA